MRGESLFVEVVFEALPIVGARSTKEYVVSFQLLGAQHSVSFRRVLRNQEHDAVSHAVVWPTDPAKIEFLVGNHQTVDRRRQSVEVPDPGIRGEGAWHSRLPFRDNSGVLLFNVEKIVGVQSESGVGGNRAGDR